MNFTPKQHSNIHHDVTEVAKLYHFINKRILNPVLMENQTENMPSWSKHWLVIYTRPRWEKKVDRLLQIQGIESYCPVRKVVNQWADRKKTVELPLFSSYVFVRINQREEYKVRQTLGVLNFIYYMARPAVIKDSVIEKVKLFNVTCPDAEVVSLEHISVGDRIRVKKGIFYDQEGTVIKIQGKNVLMIFDHLDCALVSNVARDNVTLSAEDTTQKKEINTRSL